MSAVKEKWTARGTGKCPKCNFPYSTFRKPPNCAECNFFLGGKYVHNPETVSRKKKKLDNPSSVKVCSFSGNNLYSMKLTCRDDRCFCLVSDTSRLCYFSSCKSFRSVTAASGQAELNKFSCKHLEQVKQSVCAVEDYKLSPQQVSAYPGGSDIQAKMLDAVGHANELGVPQVVRVSETSYAVCGMPDTFAENGFVHLKQVNGIFSCSVKNCRTFAGGKQLKFRNVCMHIHLVSCCLGLWKSPSTSTEPASTALHSAPSISTPPISVSSNFIATNSPSSSSTVPTCTVLNNIPIDSAPSCSTAAPNSSTSTSCSSGLNSAGSTSSVSRTSTVKLNLANWYPYHIPLHVINAARDCDCNTRKGADGGWPKEFIPEEQNCRLCGADLRPPRCHPGSQGKGFLLTNMNPFLEVNIKVKICGKVECQAMHQPQVYDLGLFNAGDKVLIALEIFLEWRELFKKGVPLSMIIECKMKSLLCTVPKDHAPSPNTVDYISDVMYNAFYSFEALTQRNMDDVVCGLCGTVGEVYYGDGNSKNCCSVKGIDYSQQEATLPTLEDVLYKITSHFVEITTYTKADCKLSTNIGEVPPLIPPCQRANQVFNTEVCKKSVYLTKKEQLNDVEGDPAMLHLLIQQKRFFVEQINELSVEMLKDICKECSVSTNQRSADFLRGRLLALYASITVGNSPCHKFTHVEGHSGGFYHIVCPHSCTVASKFLLLQESVRDAADLYLSLKHPPPLFICDTPCTLARHIDQRCPEVAEQLWGDNVGCFQKPILGQSPIKVSVPELVTNTFRTKVAQVDNISKWQHPTTGKKRRYIAGDRFHASVNPHKSELCAYHDINLLEQSNCFGTSYQESTNKTKNRRLQSSTVQSFFVHFLYNYLMDYYGNEQIVLKQRKDIESMLGTHQVVTRDKFHRFVITLDQGSCLK